MTKIIERRLASGRKTSCDGCLGHVDYFQRPRAVPNRTFLIFHNRAPCAKKIVFPLRSPLEPLPLLLRTPGHNSSPPKDGLLKSAVNPS
jgi:hypothetical protein